MNKFFSFSLVLFVMLACSDEQTGSYCYCPQQELGFCAEVVSQDSVTKPSLEVFEEVAPEIVEEAFQEIPEEVTPDAVEEVSPEVFEEVADEVVEDVSADISTIIYTGDLIKASTSAVYYYEDGCRYVFPNQDVFDSWYPNGALIKTVTDEGLAAISLCGNMMIRPGTYLVKVANVSKVYAVGYCGDVYNIKDEATATKLYGANWEDRLVVIPDGFWSNYTDTGIELVDSYSDGNLIKYSWYDQFYLVDKGEIRPISQEVMDADNYSLDFVEETIVQYNLSLKGPVLEGEFSIADYVGKCY